MASEQENLYEELKDKLKPDVTDVEIVLKAIDDRYQYYNQLQRNPKYKTIAPIKRKWLGELKKQIQSNPEIIKKHAEAFIEHEAKKKAELEDKIRQKGRILVTDGVITQETLSQLAKDYDVEEDFILKILDVKVKKKKTFSFKDDGIKPMDFNNLSELNKLLALLDCKNLYEFLNRKPSSSTEELLLGSHEKLKREVSDASGKNRVESNDIAIKDEVLKNFCFRIFDNDENRKSYDKALDLLPFADIRESIFMLKSGAAHIDPERYVMMLDMGMRKGMPKEKVEFLIYATADEARVSVDEGDGKIIECPSCHSKNSQRAEKCWQCGTHLKERPNPKPNPQDGDKPEVISKKQKPSAVTWIIAAAVFVLVVCGFVGYNNGWFANTETLESAAIRSETEINNDKSEENSHAATSVSEKQISSEAQKARSNTKSVKTEQQKTQTPTPAPKDPVAELKNKAASGDKSALSELGNMYYSGTGGVNKNLSEAQRCFEQLPTIGYEEESYMLANIYYERKNFARALQRFEELANMGYKTYYVCDKLGDMYADGQGVVADRDEAIKWYGKAANAGNADSEAKALSLY